MSDFGEEIAWSMFKGMLIVAVIIGIVLMCVVEGIRYLIT